jgi:predicted nucleotidyltransferase
LPRRPASISDTLTESVLLLEELGLRYAVVGGLAVAVWGVNRSTDDVDIFVELPQNRRAEIKRALVGRGFRVPAMDEELTKFGVFRSKSTDGVFLDLFDAVGPLGEAVLERRRAVRMGRRKIWFAAPEELAALKAFSDRERDGEDLAALLAVPGRKIDLARVTRWAARLDESIGSDEVSGRLARATAIARRPRR